MKAKLQKSNMMSMCAKLIKSYASRNLLIKTSYLITQKDDTSL